MNGLNPVGDTSHFVRRFSALTEGKNPEEVFEAAIKKFAKNKRRRSECYHACISALDNILRPLNYHLNETTFEVLKPQLLKLKKCAENNLSKQDAENFLESFRLHWLEGLKEEWAKIESQAFFPVFSLPETEDQVTYVQKWISEFFKGVECLGKWQELQSPSKDRKFVEDLDEKVCRAFMDFAYKINLEEQKRLESKIQEDPSFNKIKSRVEMQGTSLLSSAEKEKWLELQKLGRISKWINSKNHDPDILHKIDILSYCIQDGLNLIETEFSFDGPVGSYAFFQSLSLKPDNTES